MSSFSNLREGLNFIRRRFSSNDLPSDSIDEITATTTTVTTTTASITTPTTAANSPATTSNTSPTTSTATGQSQVAAKSPSPSTNSSTLSAASNVTITPSSTAVVVTSSASAASFFPTSSRGPFPSAPSSPSKGAKSSSEGYSFARNLFGRSSSKRKSVLDPRRCKILLVIDDSDVVWETYFRGRKVGGAYDVRVEQAGFSNMNVTSSAEDGVTVEICTNNEPSKSFKPDFLLVRQKVKDAHEDWSHVIMGFKHGGLLSLNDLNSVYNMADKAWVFAQLTDVKRKLGRDSFHLIPQTFSTSNKNISFPYDFPIVTRVGPAHGGIGLTKIENSSQFQDWTGFLRLSQSPSSIQPFIETKCDVRIQKIGNNYRAFTRTPITNNWKISPSQVILEEIPVTERHKTLLEECSTMFGEIDIICMQMLVAADDQEYIIGASDCTMSLIGESQEEDRKLISQLMVDKMDQLLISLRKTADATNDAQVTTDKKHPPLKDSRSQDLSTSRDQVEDSEDTMRNLRKTFAGIFGEM